MLRCWCLDDEDSVVTDSVLERESVLRVVRGTQLCSHNNSVSHRNRFHSFHQLLPAATSIISWTRVTTTRLLSDTCHTCLENLSDEHSWRLTLYLVTTFQTYFLNLLKSDPHHRVDLDTIFPGEICQSVRVSHHFHHLHATDEMLRCVNMSEYYSQHTVLTLRDQDNSLLCVKIF